ncbi:hypothetical protein, partial [Paraburkholderia sp. RL17-381-BIF-C]|uniref:hypothetical protein n=1 Tax=Paraburkholderia sp. RL17-381-BIF-C TaxID=3031635 RepID=UPI0038BB0598
NKARKGQKTQSGHKKPNAPTFPLYGSTTHILEVSQKPPYNPNQHAKRNKATAKKSPRSAKATAKKPETKPTMPKAKRQHHDAQSIAQSIARTARTASTQGPLSGPAL